MVEVFKKWLVGCILQKFLSYNRLKTNKKRLWKFYRLKETKRYDITIQYAINLSLEENQCLKKDIIN